MHWSVPEIGLHAHSPSYLAPLQSELLWQLRGAAGAVQVPSKQMFPTTHSSLVMQEPPAATDVKPTHTPPSQMLPAAQAKDSSETGTDEQDAPTAIRATQVEADPQ